MFKQKRVYLDWAAAAPVYGVALHAFMQAERNYGNPSSSHEEGRTAKAVLEDARTRLARLVEVKSEHVIFTAGATEANNLAIQGTLAAATGTKRHALYAAGAHASISETFRSLTEVETEEIPVRGGMIDLESLKRMLRPETVLVSVEAVSSETGARFDTRAVRALLQGSRTLLHVDASQLPLAESFERTRLAADLMTLDAQKVGGVRGSGALIRTSVVALKPLIQGGGQEGGFRSGTPTPALTAAFVTALEESAKERKEFSERAKRMRTELVKRITTEIPNAFLNEGKENVPHILNFSFLGRDTDYLAALLDSKGFSVSTKSACESDSADGSRTVFAQTGDAARAASTLRISWGPETREGDLVDFSTTLTACVAFLDQNPI